MLCLESRRRSRCSGLVLSPKRKAKNPMKLIQSAMVVVLTLGAATQAMAWFSSGYVVCDANQNEQIDAGDLPLQGVLVVATNQSGTFSNATWTAANGAFLLPWADQPDCYVEFIHPATLPAGSTVTLPPQGIGAFCVTSAQQTISGSFLVDNPACHAGGGCPGCVDTALGLDAVAGCTVLELGRGRVSIAGQAGGILGDVCIGPGGSLAITGSEFVTGNVDLSPGAKFQKSGSGTVGSVHNNVNLSTEINAALAASANAASLNCSQQYATLDGKNVKVIFGGSGLNVICVRDVVLSGKQILLTGAADAKFIFNVSGKFALTGGGAGPQIRVDTAAGLKSNAVLYNILGTGEAVAFSGGGGGANCCAAIVDGTILAPTRKINLSPGLVNGEVISGMDINIVSGSSVRCPPCP